MSFYGFIIDLNVLEKMKTSIVSNSSKIYPSSDTVASNLFNRFQDEHMDFHKRSIQLNMLFNSITIPKSVSLYVSPTINSINNVTDVQMTFEQQEAIKTSFIRVVTKASKYNSIDVTEDDIDGIKFAVKESHLIDRMTINNLIRFLSYLEISQSKVVKTIGIYLFVEIIEQITTKQLVQDTSLSEIPTIQLFIYFIAQNRN